MQKSLCLSIGLLIASVVTVDAQGAIDSLVPATEAYEKGEAFNKVLGGSLLRKGYKETYAAVYIALTDTMENLCILESKIGGAEGVSEVKTLYDKEIGEKDVYQELLATYPDFLLAGQLYAFVVAHSKYSERIGRPPDFEEMQAKYFPGLDSLVHNYLIGLDQKLPVVYHHGIWSFYAAD
ncbi:MAG: hypothetical protein AAFZ52_08350 [Bacteroidota bacterium]